MSDDLTTPSNDGPPNDGPSNDGPSNDGFDEAFEMAQRALAALPDARFAAAEPVPDSVLEGARWVHDWVNMDAELAQLTHDTAVTGGLAAVRSTSPLRHVRFECGSFDIHVEVEPAERGVSITGVVSPPTVGTVRALVGAVSYEGVIEEFGTFHIEIANHGVVMAYMETEQGTVRLGSFEI